MWENIPGANRYSRPRSFNIAGASAAAVPTPLTAVGRANHLATVQARFVSRTPAKFIWAGKSINDVVLKSDVIVNHFPKAKYFSSKVRRTDLAKSHSLG